MLIVLGKLPDLILRVRQSCIHTEVPISAFRQVPWLLPHWLGNMQVGGVVVAGAQPVWVHRHSVLNPPGVWKDPPVLGLQ